MHDLVIRGGNVVDGTGAAARSADVAIDDGRITEVGAVDGAARRTIAADGALITPGFVDIHTHFDGQATWDPHLTPSCWHGVTTAILGNCGVGFAPVAPDRHQWLIELMEGVEDIPGSALAEGIQWGWESFPDYLDALDRLPRALDVGTQVPHAAVRAFVMRDRAHDDATADDLAAMSAIVRDALLAGALGFSTGRTAGHRDVRGEPVPGTYAAEAEIDALLGAMDDAGRGVLQVVPAGISGELAGDAKGAMDTELAWILRLGESHTRPITFLVMENGRDPDQWRGWFDDVRAANGRGADVRPQVASRCFGVLMGHQSRLNPFRYRPSYRALADLPFDARMQRLRDPEVRAAILADEPVSDSPPSMDQLTGYTFKRLYPLGDDLDYEPSPDRSVAAIAARTGQDPWAVTCDLMLGAGGRDFLLHPLLNYARGSYDGLHDMMVDPLTIQGLGDGGAHCGIICDASMTTYLLSHWARDRTRGPKLPIELAVQRLTSAPAALYGLPDRGALVPGQRADINVIDFDRLRLLHPEQVHDLPAGAGRLIQRSEGYIETIVAGQTVVDHGELTDARPGRVVRS
ncbi:MAG: N-acyl-D-amino-acid deacylase [Acidimicrobiaceae bacterium]